MEHKHLFKKIIPILMVVAVLIGLVTLAAPQASFSSFMTLDSLKNQKIFSWSLSKTASPSSITDPDTDPITYNVAVTEGPASHILSESYTLTLTNNGSAPAYISSFVVNLQKKDRAGKYTNFASILADRANPQRSSVPTCFGNYSNSPAAQNIQVIDAASNDVVALVDVPQIAPGETKVFYISTVFDADVLALTPKMQIRKEILTTFENAGVRGKSGDLVSCMIDADGDGVVDDSRTIASRISTQIPELEIINSSVELSDQITQSPDQNIVAIPDFTIGSNTLAINGSGNYNQVIQAIGSPNSQTILSISSNAICNAANEAGGNTSVENTATLTGTNQSYISGSPASASINFICSPVVKPPTIQAGDFTTFTQGGWGAKPSGHNPGKLLADNFSSVYPGGVEVGIPGTSGSSMKFANALAIEKYLPAGGTPNTLIADLLNPLSSSSGVLGGQVLALQLNVDFDNNNITSSPVGSLTNLQVCNTGTSLDNSSIGAILSVANMVLGGGALPVDYTISSLNDLITKLNESFDNGNTLSSWASTHICSTITS